MASTRHGISFFLVASFPLHPPTEPQKDINKLCFLLSGFCLYIPQQNPRSTSTTIFFSHVVFFSTSPNRTPEAHQLLFLFLSPIQFFSSTSPNRTPEAHQLVLWFCKDHEVHHSRGHGRHGRFFLSLLWFRLRRFWGALGWTEGLEASKQAQPGNQQQRRTCSP